MERICFNRFVFALLMFGIGLNVSAQSGNVRIEIDDRIEQGMLEHLKSKDTLNASGYRVQVYFGNDKSQAEKAKQKVNQSCPAIGEAVYIVYQSPNYKVRVGNYEREVDAQKTLRVLAAEFPNVFVVRDKIDPRLGIKACE